MPECSDARLPRLSSHLLLLAAIACTSGCGDSAGTPASPSSLSSSQSGASSLPVQPGSYVISASAAVTPVVNGQTVLLEGCSGAGTFVGVSIVSFVTLGRDGATWVARSTTPDDGDVEIRFADAPGPAGLVVIAGTARGTAVSRGVDGAGVGSMTFSGTGSAAATLSGSFSAVPSPAFVGTGLGLFTVSSRIGMGSCSRATWAIREPEPCELTSSC